MQEILEEEQKLLIEKKFREEVEKRIKLAAALRESSAQQRAEKEARLKAEAEEYARYKEKVNMHISFIRDLVVISRGRYK